MARKERNESENQLLVRYAEQRECILEETSHLAARKLGLDDKAYPDDPIFRNIQRASKPVRRPGGQSTMTRYSTAGLDFWDQFSHKYRWGILLGVVGQSFA